MIWSMTINLKDRGQSVNDEIFVGDKDGGKVKAILLRLGTNIQHKALYLY